MTRIASWGSMKQRAMGAPGTRGTGRRDGTAPIGRQTRVVLDVSRSSCTLGDFAVCSGVGGRPGVLRPPARGRSLRRDGDLDRLRRGGDERVVDLALGHLDAE